MYTFTNLYALPIGFAVKGATQSSFDNFKIAPTYTVTSLHTENFNDGVANGYVPVTGTWSIVSSRYRGTIATTTDAVSLTPLATFNSGVIAADIRVVTNNGWVLFDYVNATNFKFAGIDDAANLWVIGEVVNGNKTNRATFAQTINTGTIYPLKVLLQGSTVTVVNSNAIKVRFTFASLTARPVGFSMRGSATCDFDNVSIYTEAMPSGTVGNPPALPSPTSTAGAADVAAIAYDSPAFYYNLNDHLGTARITMNQSGAVTSSVEYFPFGELKSATGCAASSQRFTGKLFDNESGLQYFGARYLSNDLTRFTAVDPAASFDPMSSQSWNRYAYSLNNPLNLTDPDGKWVVPAVVVLGTTVAFLILDNPSYLNAPDYQHDTYSNDPYVDMLGSAGMNVVSKGGGVLLEKGLEKGGGAIVKQLAKKADEKIAKADLLKANKAKGDAFRDDIADRLEKSGLKVKKETVIETPFGNRRMDIEVSNNGKKLGGIETKTGNSRYTPSQRAKDNYLKKHKNYPVNVVRDKKPE
jgi:RHS repeat-associated protein